MPFPQAEQTQLQAAEFYKQGYDLTRARHPSWVEAARLLTKAGVMGSGEAKLEYIRLLAQAELRASPEIRQQMFDAMMETVTEVAVRAEPHLVIAGHGLAAAQIGIKL